MTVGPGVSPGLRVVVFPVTSALQKIVQATSVIFSQVTVSLLYE